MRRPNNNRGVAYNALGDNRQAIRDFGRAIKRDPKYAQAYNNRGVAYDTLGDHRQAIKDYKTAAKLGYKPVQDFLKSQGISW